jgi:hypothetical protein
LETAGKFPRRFFKIGGGKSQAKQDGFRFVEGMRFIFRQS